MEIIDAREALRVRNADLTDSHFSNVKLAQATFENANLRDARFTDVNLSGCAIRDANLTAMTIHGHLVTDLIRAYESRLPAVMYAKDLLRLQTFYQALFDLRVAHAEAEHVVLTSPGTRLMIIQVPTAIAQDINITAPPQRRTATPIKLVFEVRDMQAARDTAARLGGGLDAMEHEWTYQGHRVCDGYDPEGNVVQCRQTRARL